MVLFYEDDEKLKPPPTKLRQRVRLTIRIVLIIGAMFGLSLFFMNSLGGASDTLRAGVQDYLRGTTGLQADIGNFKGVTFFPEVSVALSDVTFRREAGAAPVARVDTLNFIMGFWDVFFRRGRIRAMEVTGVHLDANLVTAQPLDIKRIGIDMNTENKKSARLAVEGIYGVDPFNISMALEAHDIGNGRHDFRRPEKSAVAVDSSFLKMEGAMIHARGGGLQFDFSSIGAPGSAVKGRAVLKRGHKGTVLSADFTSVAGKDAAVAAFDRIYCMLKPQGHALFDSITVEKISIDGQEQNISGQCPLSTDVSAPLAEKKAQ